LFKNILNIKKADINKVFFTPFESAAFFVLNPIHEPAKPVPTG
jgi:hypothetical protein